MKRKIIITLINDKKNIYSLKSYEDDVVIENITITGTMAFTTKLLQYMMIGFTAKHEKGSVELVKND